MDITHRPAKFEDLEDAERVVQEAGNELRVRHDGQPWRSPPPIEFPKFCLMEDLDGLWGAEDGDTIVGFSFSWMTEKLWFLSQLFFRPDTQVKGIGQALLSKTLIQAERNGATNRALISPAYNIASTGLYLNNGLYPREPLYRMAAPVQAVAQSLADAGYDVTPIAAWPVSRMSGPAGPIRSYSDSAEICTTDFCSAALRRALRIERAGRAAGYAYISTRGHVGPLAIAPDADAKAVVTTALCCALESGPSRVSMIVPSWADAVMQAVLALGFRIEEPYVLVASRPFGNWNNYLPGAPVLCSRQQMEREMESRPPSIVDLNAELAKLTMFRGRTPQSTMADRKGSAARLASYRDGALTITKFAGKGHWESHLTGDELIHVLDGTATLEIVCDDGPPKSFALRAGTMVVIPQGAWHRFLSSEGATLMTATPFPGEVIELDVDDPRTVERKP